jgi:hypothetical protein
MPGVEIKRICSNIGPNENHYTYDADRRRRGSGTDRILVRSLRQYESTPEHTNE